MRPSLWSRAASHIVTVSEQKYLWYEQIDQGDVCSMDKKLLNCFHDIRCLREEDYVGLMFNDFRYSPVYRFLLF